MEENKKENMKELNREETEKITGGFAKTTDHAGKPKPGLGGPVAFANGLANGLADGLANGLAKDLADGLAAAPIVGFADGLASEKGPKA